MTDDEFKALLLEQTIFNNIKDKPLHSSEWFRKTYKDYKINFRRIYTRLVKYQVKTYGSTLYSGFVNIYGNDPKLIKYSWNRRYKRLR